MSKTWEVTIVASVDDENDNLTPEQAAERGFEAIRNLEAPVVTVQVHGQTPPAPTHDVDLEEVWAK